MCAFTCVYTCMEISEQLLGVTSLLPVRVLRIELGFSGLLASTFIC